MTCFSLCFTASGFADRGFGACGLTLGKPMQSWAFLLARSAPHTRGLSGFERPGQALVAHRATGANLLGGLDILQSRAGRSHEEEEFRVLIRAGCGAVRDGPGRARPGLRGALVGWRPRASASTSSRTGSVVHCRGVARRSSRLALLVGAAEASTCAAARPRCGPVPLPGAGPAAAR